MRNHDRVTVDGTVKSKASLLLGLSLTAAVCAWPFLLHGQEVLPEQGGVTETTPSRSHFFDWINSQYEGSTEAHTLTNLAFFRWLHDAYGMQLDVYSLDVGNIDDGPYTAGVGRHIPAHYGSLESPEFQAQFPRGFRPLADRAAEFDCRLGIWLGPDGFGSTAEEERTRREMMVELCRDYNFLMFKLDTVAGGLRPEKQQTLAQTLEECRRHCPDLIVLNERVTLGEAAPHTTTSLWAGAETYIDVFMSNDDTALHHRAGALARPTIPGLTRLLEDHGVCFSSCLDFWEDDLVLQAFNRNSVVSPQIYGNPWFLRDDEFPKLARLFNLHRRHRERLVSALRLPEDLYGPYALSRGDGQIRFLTLRNLTWEPVAYRVRLDESIGLARAATVELCRFHPSERIYGDFAWGETVTIEVPPFRSCLLAASTAEIGEIGVVGCDYEIVRDVPDKPVLIDLLGQPGQTLTARLDPAAHRFRAIELDGAPISRSETQEPLEVTTPGKAPRQSWHRRLGRLRPCPMPADAEALYEATCFAADSNALEVRAVQRSGPSEISEVIAARQAFFAQPMFVNRGIWDRNLFDGDIETAFQARLEDRALRIDFGAPMLIDTVTLRMRDRESANLAPDLYRFAEGAVAEVSADLRTWRALEPRWGGVGTIAVLPMPDDQPVRYLRAKGARLRIAEVEARRDGELLDRSAWRASNLFHPYEGRPARHSWQAKIELAEIPPGAILAVAVNGEHGDEGAYAALRVGGKLIGAHDRAVSFPSNTWEYYNVERERGYTYFFHLSPDMTGKPIEVVLLGFREAMPAVGAEAWLTCYEAPVVRHRLVLHRRR